MQKHLTTSAPLVTRRGFVKGAITAAAAIGASAALSPILEASVEGRRDAHVAWADTSSNGAIDVSEENVVTTEGFEFLDTTEGSMSLVSQAHLPYGTVVWAEDDQVAACLLPCETSDPLMQVGLLSLASGEMSTIVKEAAGRADGFQVFDARANSNGAIWVEADIMNERWRVYTAKLSDSWALGTPQLAVEGGSDWQMPSIATSGGFGFWQMLPSQKGAAADEDSLLMRIPFGAPEDEAKVVFESEGCMACAPSSTAKGIVIAPRISAPSTQYQIVHIDASSGQPTDTMVLPAGMKPSFVGYGGTGFSFAFEDIYNYGDGISNLGTYTPTSEGSAEWFHFPRTPVTSPAWSGRWFFVKSTSVVAAIDMEDGRYLAIEPEHTSQGYGEFLASCGNGWRIVTYNNIDYTPLNGQLIKECNVRVWQPA